MYNACCPCLLHPSSAFYSMAAVTVDCVLSGTTQAVCSGTAPGSAPTAIASAAASATATGGSGGDQNFPAQTTATLQGSDYPPFQQVVITAGLSNLKASGSSSSSASTTGSATSKGASSGASSGSGSSTATGSSSSSTAQKTSGAGLAEPVLAFGAAGMIAVGIAAFAL